MSARRSAGVEANACPAMSAEALVLLITIIWLLLKAPPVIGATMSAYRP